MTGIPFEQSLKIKQLSKDFFESIYPSWTWPDGSIVPGGVLMAFAAAAAYETLEDDWAIDTLQSHFLLGPDATVPLRFKVQRLSDGGRFAVRAVEVLQGGKVVCFVTCSFVRPKSLHGPSMQHTVSRATDLKVSSITLDDLASTSSSSSQGNRWMQFQRLGVVFPPHQTNDPHPSSTPSPSKGIYTSVGTIPSLNSFPPTNNNTNTNSNNKNNQKLHALGLIALSDYHVLDGPPHLHSLTTNQPPIGQNPTTSTTPPTRKSDFQRLTSLNHNIHFRLHEGFQASELCYVEVTSAWTGARRGGISSRIFTPSGELIACCFQEGYFVLFDGGDAAGDEKKGDGDANEKKKGGSKL
ncbi:uncharacterized protein RCC_12034 [Ramularia collo-cygni]|uniref:Acyl-CoA thiolesterase n=1 Tax=Ramularia collo-cygni TaxID=112498 RepID=A0A2D3V2B0_9PEZI|nr:uncharacterized protein RCC_12034 [Ramularia collo-cygni]CZT15639.1 uncharacterized protein RCC_12034 [Ramularia collo-cygni]